MKRCSKCGADKPIDDFWRNASKPDGRHAHCKACSKASTDNWRELNPERVAAHQRRSRAKRSPLHNAYLRLSRYGLTPARYEAMLCAQAGRCAICDSELAGKRDPHVDHCHASKAVRALLCSRCNTGLGLFREDPAALRAAAHYLEEHAK